MNCFFCRDTRRVLKNCYAGDIQPYDEEPTVTQLETVNEVPNTPVEYTKMVACHKCNYGGPSAEPVDLLVKSN